MVRYALMPLVLAMAQCSSPVPSGGNATGLSRETNRTLGVVCEDENGKIKFLSRVKVALLKREEHSDSSDSSGLYYIKLPSVDAFVLTYSLEGYWPSVSRETKNSADPIKLPTCVMIRRSPRVSNAELTKARDEFKRKTQELIKDPDLRSAAEAFFERETAPLKRNLRDDK